MLRLSLRGRLPVDEAVRVTGDTSFGDTSFVIASKGAPGTQPVSAWQPYRLAVPFAPWQAIPFRQTALTEHPGPESIEAHGSEEEKKTQVSGPVLTSSQPESGASSELTWSPWKVSRGY